MDTNSLAALLVQTGLEYAVPLLIAAVSPALAWIASLLNKAQINSVVTRAIGRGVGAAYMSLLQDRRGADQTAVAKAESAAVDFVMGGPSVVPLLPKAGISPDRLREIVSAELGVLLSKDPTVSIGGAR